MGHQKAAFQVLKAIFSSKSIMETPIGRTCLNWYSRYDTYVAIIGGFPTDLPKHWFMAMEEYNRLRCEAESTALRWKVDLRASQLRSISQDMSLLYARGSRGQIGPQDFDKEHDRIKKALEDFKSFWDAALLDPKYLVADESYHSTPGPEDIVDPYAPGLLYGPPLFTNTLVTAEWHSIMIMHMSQAVDIQQPNVRAELTEHAYASCQYFEAVEFWPQKPNGALISLQPCISIAALFLPQDDRHQMWVRRKFALLDTMG